MTTPLTLARLRDLRLSGMAQALTQQQEQASTYEALPFLEQLGLLVEQECLVCEQRKQDRLILRARFKLRATVQDIDYQHPRNLQPAQDAGPVRAWDTSSISASVTCPRAGSLPSRQETALCGSSSSSYAHRPGPKNSIASWVVPRGLLLPMISYYGDLIRLSLTIV